MYAYGLVRGQVQIGAPYQFEKLRGLGLKAIGRAAPPGPLQTGRYRRIKQQGVIRTQFSLYEILQFGNVCRGDAPATALIGIGAVSGS